MLIAVPALALATIAGPAAGTAAAQAAPPVSAAVPVAPPATPVLPGPAPSAAALGQARRLQEVVEPHARMVAGNLQGWEATMKRALALDPGFPALEQAYSGVGAAAIDAARPLARIFCEQFVERVSSYKAELYARRLTQQEMAAAISFFETRAGRTLVERMIANASPDALADQIIHQAVEQGRLGLSMEQTQQVDRSAALKTARETSAEDQIAMIRFQQTAAGRRFLEVRREAEPGVLQIVNSPDAELIRRQHDAMLAAILAYVDSKKSH